MLTELQRRKLTRLFNVFDADGNGYIEKADYEQIMRNFAEISPSNSNDHRIHELYLRFMRLWENMRKYADTNGDERVSLQEFLADRARVLNSPERYQNRILAGESLFQLLDQDGDGEATLEELRLFYRGLRIDEQLAEEVFPRLDLNGDGHISKEEFFQIGYDFHYSNDPKAAGNWFLGPY